MKVYEFVEDCQLLEEESPLDSVLCDLYGRVMDAKGWKDTFSNLTEVEEIKTRLNSFVEDDLVIEYISRTWVVRFQEYVIKEER